jgi:hypothetical protein
MPFKKGESGNKSGRPAGSKNKTPEEIRTALLKFVDDNLEGVTKDFKKLKADKKLIFFEKIVRHVLPAPSSFEKLTEAQLDQLLIYLRKKYINEQTEKEG